jgi:uncharacterized membrane protein HdeD (DUF308 family)
MNLEAHLHDSERKLAHIWKAMALRGAVAIAFSIVILGWPSIGVTALIALFGAFALASGLATIFGASGASNVGELERSFRPRPTAKPVAHG